MAALGALAIDLAAIAEAFEQWRRSGSPRPYAPRPSSANASFALLVESHISGRLGSPSVAAPRRPRRFSGGVGSARVSAGLPPPERRIFQPARSSAPIPSSRDRSYCARFRSPAPQRSRRSYPAERAPAAALRGPLQNRHQLDDISLRSYLYVSVATLFASNRGSHVRFRQS